MKRIGRMQSRITIKQFVSTGRDNFGKEQGDWQEVKTCWARIVPTNSQEQTRQDQVTTLASYDVTIRLDESITEKMAVFWGERILNIGGVVHDYEDSSTLLRTTEGR